MLCGMAGVHRRFGGRSCFILQGRKLSQERKKHAARYLASYPAYTRRCTLQSLLRDNPKYKLVMAFLRVSEKSGPNGKTICCHLFSTSNMKIKKQEKQLRFYWFQTFRKHCNSTVYLNNGGNKEKLVISTRNNSCVTLQPKHDRYKPWQSVSRHSI
jgi:hypothetical protein